MLALVRKAVAEAELTERVRLLRAQIPPLPFSSQSFDAVISDSLLHHLTDAHAFWLVSGRL